MQEDESTQPNKVVGRNVALRRQAMGLSQADLANQLAAYLGKDRIDPTTVTRLESGKRPTTVDELAALSKILDTDAQTLLTPTLNSNRSAALERAASLIRHHGHAAFDNLIKELAGIANAYPDWMEQLPPREMNLIQAIGKYNLP